MRRAKRRVVSRWFWCPEVYFRDARHGPSSDRRAVEPGPLRGTLESGPSMAPSMGWKRPSKAAFDGSTGHDGLRWVLGGR